MVVTVSKGLEASTVACGSLVPLGLDVVAQGLTRSLKTTRMRWSHAWKFMPSMKSDEEKPGVVVFGPNTGEVEVSAFVVAIGTDTLGQKADCPRQLVFNGQVVQCDSDALNNGLRSVSSVFLESGADPHRTQSLEIELERVNELLDLETDCKYAILAKDRLIAAKMAASEKSDFSLVESDSAETYRLLSELDPKRHAFYEEALAACTHRARVLAWLTDPSDLGAPLKLNSIGYRHITPAMLLPTFGIRILDVSGNGLETFGPILMLVSLEELDASDNRLTGCVAQTFMLPRLRQLDVHNNQLTISTQSSTALRPPPGLEHIDLSGNQAILALGGEDNAPEHIIERVLVGMSENDRSLWTIKYDSLEKLCVCCR